MIFDPNPLYFQMAKMVQEKPSESKLIIGNEGSSRSAKTWDTIHLIVSICDSNRGKKLDILFFRDTLVNCKEYLLKDFMECLIKMNLWDDRNLTGKTDKPNYNLFGQIIKFRGLDDGSKEIKEGTGSDILFFNEILSGCEKERVNGFIMRCRFLVIADWNPKYTDHWFFNFEKRNDCYFTKSTYKQNRHLQKAVINEIESYSPWLIEDMHLPELERRINQTNVDNGTIDKFRWTVYGMGERANREGLVFPEVTWVDEFPEDLDEISYGVDFGETAQTAIVKTGLRMVGNKYDLYLQKLFYCPTENSDIVAKAIKSLGITKHIWCDNNQPGWVSDLRNIHEIEAFVTKKFPGSREYWITSIKRYNIHIVKDIDFRKEQENFSYRVVDGIQLSETIKKYDHLWSATGYSVVGDFRYLSQD